VPDDPALSLFNGLTSYVSLEDLIRTGEVEGQYLECKSPKAPQLGTDTRLKLAEAASGFANSGGGVILWGISTTHHAHAGLDVLSQLEPLGNARPFGHQIDRAIRTDTNPSISGATSKVLPAEGSSTKGIIATYVPPTSADPVQSVLDKNFYIRVGDAFHEMPYDILRRMFAGALSPDLRPIFNSALVEKDAAGAWTIPILVRNHSSFSAESAKLILQVTNPDACDSITPTTFSDQSRVNPGRRLYIADLEGPLYRGLNQQAGSLKVVMKRQKRPRRVLNLTLTIHANRMRARRWNMRVQLAQKGFSVTETGDSFLY